MYYSEAHFIIDLLEGLAIVIGKEVILINKIGDEWLEGFGFDWESNFIEHLLIFCDGGEKDLSFELFILISNKDLFDCLGILIPDVFSDKGGINDDHIEEIMELLWNILRLIEIIKDKIRVLPKLFVKLW